MPPVGDNTVKWLSTIISGAIAALCTLMMFFLNQSVQLSNQRLDRIQQDIRSNQILIVDGQKILTNHLITHPDRELDKRLTLVEQTLRKDK